MYSPATSRQPDGDNHQSAAAVREPDDGSSPTMIPVPAKLARNVRKARRE
jgi:hypothetical protein